MSDTQLPAEVVEKIRSRASFICSHDPNEDSTPFRSGMYSGYISGATEYATKLIQAEQQVKEWKEECERQAKNAEYWQQEYYKLNPPRQPMKIDNNPIT
jgi:hypothetical protein